MNIVVTGAGGYVGRHVVTALADLGHTVIGTARPGSRRDIDPRAEVMEVDLLGSDLDAALLFGQVPDVLVHLAWTDGFTHNALSHMEQLSAHFHFLTSMAEQGVNHIAALGTMHEIGYWEGAIDFSTPSDPVSLYGIAKDSLRRGLQSAISADITFQWLRCFYIYGDDRNNQSIFSRILVAADEGKANFPFTSGVNEYDFVRVEELGRQIASVVSQREVTGIINCCSGQPSSLSAQVERFIEENELAIALDYGAFPDRPYDSPGVWGDATLVREIMMRLAGAR